MTGITNSPDFPSTQVAIPGTRTGTIVDYPEQILEQDDDGFVWKLNPAGQITDDFALPIIFDSNPFEHDEGTGIAVNQEGTIFVTGFIGWCSSANTLRI